EHAERCDDCGARLLALSAAKQAWAGLATESPRVARMRDARALSRFHRGAPSRRAGAFFAGTAFGGVVVAALAGLWFHRSEAAVGPREQIPVVQAVVPLLPPSGSATTAPPAVEPAYTRPTTGLVVKRTCSTCRAGDLELAAGAPLPNGA